MTKKKLILTDGTRERELQLAGRIVVGRDPTCEISHDDSLLSRRHAEFLTVGESVTLRDLGSRNGVFVNGERIMDRKLTAGDVVQIGPLRATFVLDDAPTSVITDAVDGDRTAVIRKIFTGSQLDMNGVSAGVATVDGDDDEVTRMVRAPRLSTAGEAAEQPYVRTQHDGESPTLHIRPPDHAARPAASRTPRIDGGLFHAILAPVLMLSLLVAGTALLPSLMSLSASWLALPVVIAFGGAYAVSLSINRRVSEALAAAERDRA